jgi:hypothetical protein
VRNCVPKSIGPNGKRFGSSSRSSRRSLSAPSRIGWTTRREWLAGPNAGETRKKLIGRSRTSCSRRGRGRTHSVVGAIRAGSAQNPNARAQRCPNLSGAPSFYLLKYIEISIIEEGRALNLWLIGLWYMVLML